MGFMRDMDDMSYSIKCGIWRSQIGVQTLRGTLEGQLPFSCTSVGLSVGR